MNIDLRFYNVAEKSNFETNYPEECKILELFVGDVEFPIEDFKTYFLFTQQNSVLNGLRSFNDFKNILSSDWDAYKRYFKYEAATGKFTSTWEHNNQQNHISESLGVAGALSITSKCFMNITQADWTRIPISNKHKDLDYEICASDGKFYFVEAKGSIVKDNQKLTEISSLKGKITKKKGDDKFKKLYYETDENGKLLNFLFGVVTAADMNNHLVVRLVDPPAININFNPAKFKLLSRLYYYLELICIISERSRIAILLANRIKEIERLDEYMILDSLPLINSNFEKLIMSDAYFSSKTTNQKKNLFGRTFLVDNNEIYFVGLSSAIIEILINQKFESILNYKEKPSTTSERLRCAVSKDEIEKIKELNNIKEKSIYDKQIYSFDTYGNIIRASSGIVYSKLELKDILRYGKY